MAKKIKNKKTNTKNKVQSDSKDNNFKYNHSANQSEEFDVRKKKFWKFWVVMVFICVGMLTVLGRLLYIQLINSEEYKKLALRQQQTKQEIIPQRGNIYDRNGNLLASTIKSISIAVDPTELKNKEKLAILIERHIGINKEEILNKINSAKGQFVRLCRHITPDKVEEIKKLKDRGILLIDEPTRYYNYSSIASQIIGCTSVDNKGLNGIELGYDSLLRGKSGYMIMYRDAKQRLRPALNLPTIEPINGANLYLTLDIELQKIVEFELMQGVENSGASSGTIIALEPNTGEILACASYPGYNPNLPSTYSSQNMRIRSVADAYEPGSTFKAITASAGIEEKLVKPTDVFNGYNGAFIQTTYTIKDEHPLGLTDLTKAFEYSSNIVLSQVALKIPDKKYYKYIRDFGFGLKTGIDIPGEVSGRIPRFDIINSIDKRFLGFGYGIMVTPIQLVNAYSAIANGGKLMKPFIVSKITDGDNVIKGIEPQFIRNVISDNTAHKLNDLLVGVVDNGTGTKAHIKDLKIAGKTGTAQMLVSGSYSKSNHLASFIGYYPADNPKICMLVFVDNPKNNTYGGSVAAPIFKNIALRWASISPSILDAQSNTITNNRSSKVNQNNNFNHNIVYVPELKGISIDDAAPIISDLGLKMKNDNVTGIITSQFPKAGAKVLKNSTIILNVDNHQNNINNVLLDLKGLGVRRAITLLHNAGYKANVRGNGVVKEQKWENKNGEKVCVLICE